jgi:selenocysteine lyase/cysteine desulfurase
VTATEARPASNPTAPIDAESEVDPRAGIVGAELEVPLVTGGSARFVNLDYAASAPCLEGVAAAVAALLPWYSSVHRGAGYPSQLATAAYEGAREAVHTFVGARASDVVIFTRNTTDALNLLASALPADAQVFVFASEHHADLLPWRRRDRVVLPVPGGPGEALQVLARALAGRDRHRPALVAVTGASNVTGEIWPYEQLAAVAHRFGARVVLDAAQLAPHRRIDMAASDVDYLAFSGHKLYAPFGAGVLVGSPGWLREREPFLAGGGAVAYVGSEDVVWAGLPDRQEAGTPNLVGAVALGVACRLLTVIDLDRQAARETALLDAARARLAELDGVEIYRLWAAGHPRIGVLPFAVRGVPYAQLAAALSAEHGIGVRHGCFCAHRLMATLLRIDAAEDARFYDAIDGGETVAMPGAVRASIGLGTTARDLDRLVDAVSAISVDGPRWSYRSSADGSDCWPDPDPRPRPALPFDVRDRSEGMT